MNRTTGMRIAQGLSHIEIGKGILQELISDLGSKSGAQKGRDIAELETENAQLRQTNAIAAIEIESLRRDFGRFLADMRASAGGHVPGKYCSYFEKSLIDSIWHHHEFDAEFEGEVDGARGRLIDIPLTFDMYMKKGIREHIDEKAYGLSEFLHAGCTYQGTIWMDEDSAQDFLKAIRQGLQVQFWTSARKGEEANAST